MPLSRSILAEFNYEMASTRRLLERVPEEHAPWKPHPKSYSLGGLAVHVASQPAWIPIILEQDDFNFDESTQRRFPREFVSHVALLERFDENVAAAASALPQVSDDALKQPWTLKSLGTVRFTIPRVAALRSFVMNHHIHHRGQLTVYLRMKDVPLPAIYGSSADETMK